MPGPRAARSAATWSTGWALRSFDAEVALGDTPAWRGSSRTDHRGHFTMAGVEPGERRLWARHRDAGETPVAAPVRVYPLQESPGVVLRLPGQLRWSRQ